MAGKLYRHSIVVGQSNAAGGRVASTSNPEYDTVVDPGPQTNPRALTFDATGTPAPITQQNNQYFPLFGNAQLVQKTIVERAQPAFDPALRSITTHAKGGTAYTGLKKGTATYAEAISYITAARDKLAQVGDGIVVESMHVVHGEADSGSTTRATYLAALNEWLADFTADIRAVTGQANSLLGVIGVLGQPGTSGVVTGMLDAHRTNPRYVVGHPQYAVRGGTSIHLHAHGHYKNGEYHARALAKTLITGQKWEPVHPKSITRSGNVITAVFNVPTAPLVIDTTTLINMDGTPAGAVTNRGFEFFDDSATPPTITAVNVTAADTVQITLSATPTGGNQRLRYAYGGPTGNLRDSDTQPSSLDGLPLRNWCLPFDDAVGFTYTPLALPADIGYKPSTASYRRSGATVAPSGARLGGVSRSVQSLRRNGQTL